MQDQRFFWRMQCLPASCLQDNRSAKNKSPAGQSDKETLNVPGTPNRSKQVLARVVMTLKFYYISTFVDDDFLDLRTTVASRPVA